MYIVHLFRLETRFNTLFLDYTIIMPTCTISRNVDTLIQDSKSHIICLKNVISKVALLQYSEKSIHTMRNNGLILTVGSLTHRVHNSAVFKVASLHASIYSYAVQLLKLHVFGRIIMNPSYNLGSLIKNLMSNCTEENSPNYNKIKWLIFILSEWEVSFYAVVIHHVVYLFLDDSFLPLQGTPIPEITRAVLGFSGLIYCLCYLHGTPIPEMSAGDIAWWKCCLQYKSEKLKTNKKQKPKNTMKM